MAKKKDVDVILSKLDVEPNLDRINNKCDISFNNNSVNNKPLRLRPIYLSLGIIIVLLITLNITIITLYYRANETSTNEPDDKPNNTIDPVVSTEYEVIDTIFNDEVVVSPDMNYKEENNMQITVVEKGKDKDGNVLYSNMQIEIVDKIILESSDSYNVFCASGLLIKYNKTTDEWEVIE